MGRAKLVCIGADESWQQFLDGKRPAQREQWKEMKLIEERRRISVNAIHSCLISAKEIFQNSQQLTAPPPSFVHSIPKITAKNILLNFIPFFK
jgi:hypothetical protein